jgi:hypothetical protein
MTITSRFFLVLCFFTILESAASSQSIHVLKKVNVATGERDEGEPRLVYNSVSKNFLIGWIDRLWGPHDEIESRIRTRLMKPDGSLSPLRTYETTYGLFGLLMQHDPNHNQFLMIWNGYPVDYRLLGPNGGVKKKGKTPGGLTLVITYHPLTNEYLIAEPLRRFSFNGVPQGKSSNEEYAYASLIPDPASTNYFLFFRDLNWVTYYQILRSDGTAITSPRPILQNMSDFSVAFNPSRREFLVVYMRPFWQSRAIRINENGGRIGKPIVLTNKPEVWSSVIFYDDRFIVAYNVDNRIFVRQLSATGQLLGSPVPLTDKNAAATEFQMARGDGGNFAIVWSQEDIDGIPPDTWYDIFVRFFRIL